MKADDIRHMTVAEIEAQFHDLEEELFNLRFQKATRQIGDPNRIKTVRRDIARLKTILREHELGIYVLEISEEMETVPDEGIAEGEVE